MLNAVQNTVKLENEYKEAARVKNEDNVYITDVVYMLNCIKGEAFMSLKK